VKVRFDQLSTVFYQNFSCSKNTALKNTFLAGFSILNEGIIEISSSMQRYFRKIEKRRAMLFLEVFPLKIYLQNFSFSKSPNLTLTHNTLCT